MIEKINKIIGFLIATVFVLFLILSFCFAVVSIYMLFFHNELEIVSLENITDSDYCYINCSKLVYKKWCLSATESFRQQITNNYELNKVDCKCILEGCFK